MKANTKYTALEILTAAKVENAAELFGKMRIRIAGIAGIVTPDHLIKIGAGIESIDIIVGTDSFQVKIEGAEEEFVVTEEAKKVLKIKGTKATEAIEARDKAKKEAIEKAKTEEVKK